MTIDGWDVLNANARQFNVIWGYHSINSTSEWLPGNNSPTLFENTIGFKPLQVILCAKDEGRNAIRMDISRILAALKGPVSIELDNMDHAFYGILRSFSAEETAIKRWHQLTLNLEGYECGRTVTVSGSGSIEIENPGTLPSPAVLTITPTAGMSNLTIQGLGDVFTIENLQSGETVVIDGETGLITQGGALKEVDFYTLPVVQPGNSTVIISRSQATVQVDFKPRYM